MKIKSIIWLSIIALFIFNCSGEKEIEKHKSTTTDFISAGNIRTSEVNLKITKLYPWLNLMPGKTQRTFNITGEISVLSGASYNFRTLTLTLIKIYQDGAFLYLIKPTIRQSLSSQESDFKKIIFSTIKGVQLIPFYKINNMITVELIFDNNGKTLRYTVPNVKVDKTY